MLSSSLLSLTVVLALVPSIAVLVICPRLNSRRIAVVVVVDIAVAVSAQLRRRRRRRRCRLRSCCRTRTHVCSHSRAICFSTPRQVAIQHVSMSLRELKFVSVFVSMRVRLTFGVALAQWNSGCNAWFGILPLRLSLRLRRTARFFMPFAICIRLHAPFALQIETLGPAAACIQQHAACEKEKKGLGSGSEEEASTGSARAESLARRANSQTVRPGVVRRRFRR